MANYLVGDIQGCLDELLLLLDTVSFDKQKDILWVAGDLVARGPKSLETLRFLYQLGDSARVVLGNHDLHLLAVSQGVHRVKEKDRTAPIFSADDREQLLTWLRHQPLLAEHEEFVMCHAGISPQWDLDTARAASKEIETLLQSERWRWLIESMYGNGPTGWNNQLTGIERYRYIINAFTRMRFCFSNAHLDMDSKLPPESASSELIPWFDVQQRIPIRKTIIFGHWAALMGINKNNVIGLDTGCVWGNHLTLLRWEDKALFEQHAL